MNFPNLPDPFKTRLKHGLTPAHPYDPHYSFTLDQKQAYFEGFDQGVDAKLGFIPEQ